MAEYSCDKVCNSDITNETLSLCENDGVEQNSSEQYLNSLVKTFEDRNTELLNKLDQMCNRIEIMETTIPALMTYNLLNSNPSFDKKSDDVEVFKVVETNELDRSKESLESFGSDKKSDDVEVFKVVETNELDRSKESLESFGSATDENQSEESIIKQLLQLEKLMVEEQRKKNQIKCMHEREEKTKEDIVNFDVPSSKMYQKTARTKVHVPESEGQPHLIEYVNKLRCALSAFQNCKACSKIKIDGLTNTVDTLIRILKNCALAECERDKPADLPFDENIQESKTEQKMICNCSPLCTANKIENCTMKTTEQKFDIQTKKNEISLCSLCRSKQSDDISLCDCTKELLPGLSSTDQKDKKLWSRNLYFEMTTKFEYE